MAVYKGLLQNGILVTTNNTGVRVASSSPNSTIVEFPVDVRLAYVQATNRFLDDRLTFGALTVWSVRAKPKQLVFENEANGNGGNLSFQVEPTLAVQTRKKASPKKAAKAVSRQARR